MLAISDQGLMGDLQGLQGDDVSLNRSLNQPQYPRNAPMGAREHRQATC